jgi:hypothetical protein
MSQAEVIAAYERYLKAFLADDLAAIDALVQYPLAYIGAGKVSMLDKWPFKPSAFESGEGMAHQHRPGIRGDRDQRDQGASGAEALHPRAPRRQPDRGCLRLLCLDPDRGRLEDLRPL